MMNLHSRVPIKRVLGEPDAFDFLQGLPAKILRVDECHPSENNDAFYTFLIWVDPEDHEIVKKAIAQNCKHLNHEREWRLRLDESGPGLLIVHTWI